MDIVESNSKKYEEISQKHKLTYSQILDSIPIIKRFIIDNNLIIYGGTAIDYALRLYGDYIYPDESLSIPDLDFYSPNNVKHAYDLADKLYSLGYKEVRTIRALYVTTMRVDIIDNNFVADITYVSKNIFDVLPTLEYEGMRIIHPDFQKIDLHRSLSFPYENAPWEVIFARWKKDIIRYNKLADKYPINCVAIKEEKLSIVHTIDIKYINNVFAGLPAYAIIYTGLKNLENSISKKYRKIPIDYSGIIEEYIKITDTNITLHTINNIAEFVNTEYNTTYTGEIRNYNAYMSILPKYYTYKDNDVIIKTYITKHKLISSNNSEIDDIKIRHINVQTLLFMLLANSHIHPNHSNIYLKYYYSTLRMIEIAEQLFIELNKHLNTKEINELVLHCPLFPSVYTYGSDNKNEAYDILMQNILIDTKKADPFYLPINYYPSRSKINHISRPLEFIYDKSKFFKKNGLQ